MKMRMILHMIVATALLSSAQAATLSVETKDLGATPDVLGYNMSYFQIPHGSNAPDWYRYSGVNGVRLFLRISRIEPKDDLPPRGDGVTDQASFEARRAALRKHPLDLKYINWPVFRKGYEKRTNVSYTLGQMRQLGMNILVNITAGMHVNGKDDWAGKWELWQHYYAEAFYLSREFGVERFQMYNEPNHGGGKLSIDEYMMKLKIISDAIQSAVADVNRLYKRSLKAMINAPVTSGNPVKSYPRWGKPIVENLHTNYLGKTDPSFNLVQIYSYQSYNSTPESFGAAAAKLHKLLQSDMAPAASLPIAVTEFNTYMGAKFRKMTETLDTPRVYARFGGIAVNLMANGVREMYVYRFPKDKNPTINSNGMFYVDNSTKPYNVGGITKAGEVWRLFNKAFATGRRRLAVHTNGAANGLYVQASYDPVSQRYYLFSVNDTDKPIPMKLDLSAWKIPPGNRVMIEEVSEHTYGAIENVVSLPDDRVVRAGHQPPHSVWLVSTTELPQKEVRSLTATDDAEVRDGVYAATNFGNVKTMLVRNDPVTVDNRSAVFLKFNLKGMNLKNLLTAELVLNAATATSNATAQAYVYGLKDDAWKQAGITWHTAPNLRSNVPAGNTIPYRVVTGQGNTAFIVGQLVTTSATPSKKRLDVTGFIRSQRDGLASFLICQDPRWNVTLPSKKIGDTQPDGIQISATEASKGASLLLTFKAP